jgi:hypothetical protein
MISDFLGSIGGLEFITGDQAFTEAAEAQRSGSFGKAKPPALSLNGDPSMTLSVPSDAPKPDALDS